MVAVVVAVVVAVAVVVVVVCGGGVLRLPVWSGSPALATRLAWSFFPVEVNIKGIPKAHSICLGSEAWSHACAHAIGLGGTSGPIGLDIEKCM